MIEALACFFLGAILSFRWARRPAGLGPVRPISRLAALATILGIALLIRLIDPTAPRGGFFYAACPVMLVMGVAIMRFELWLGWFGSAGAENGDR